MKIRHAATLAALISSIGCGAQPPAGVVETGSNVSRSGCTVDLKQICKNFFDQPTFMLNGVQYDSQRLASSAPRHMDAVLPYNYPNGTLLAAVNCQLDTQTHRITRADLAAGPPIDGKAVAYVRSQGLSIAAESQVSPPVRTEIVTDRRVQKHIFIGPSSKSSMGGGANSPAELLCAARL